MNGELEKNILGTPQEEGVSWKKAVIQILAVVVVLSGVGLGVGYYFFWDKPVHKDPVDYQLQYAYNLVKNNPKNASLRVELAYALAQRRQLDEAQKELENALALDRKNFSAKLNLAIIMGEKGDMKGAKVKLEEVAKEYPKSEDVKFLLGQAYLEIKEYKKAREQFDYVLKANPGTVDYIYWIAKSFEMEGNKQEAIKQYKTTIAYVPDYMPSIEALKALGVKEIPKSSAPTTPNHGAASKTSEKK